MNVTQLYITRQLVGVLCGLIGMALLAIGAQATLDFHTLDAPKVVPTVESVGATQLALIIGNGNYPDAAEPLIQPINDASDLADAMRHRGFDVDMVQDATKNAMSATRECRSRPCST
jgi:hypothetical protein